MRNTYFLNYDGTFPVSFDFPRGTFTYVAPRGPEAAYGEGIIGNPFYFIFEDNFTQKTPNPLKIAKRVKNSVTKMKSEKDKIKNTNLLDTYKSFLDYLTKPVRELKPLNTYKSTILYLSNPIRKYDPLYKVISTTLKPARDTIFPKKTFSNSSRLIHRTANITIPTTLVLSAMIPVLTTRQQRKLPEQNSVQQTGQTKKGSTTQNSNQVVPKTYEDMYNNLNVKQLEYLDSFGISPFLMPSIFKNALNNKFNLSLKEDNNWSDEDLKALDLILAKSALEPTKIESEIKEPEPVKVESGISGAPTNFTRADIRAILSHYGINPYSLSGSLRKSLRKFFGGDSSQDISFIDKDSKLYKEWITPFTVYKKKQGGVISRNAIYRFKNRLK